MNVETYMGGAQEATTSGTPGTIYPALGRCASVTPHANNGEIKMPARSTPGLKTGADQFVIYNPHETYTLVVTDSSGNSLGSVAPGGFAHVSLTAARWVVA